ncbi:MAG: PD-(D/E)XK nuclease family protein [Gammaproteobacteria bacterium]
MNTAAQPSPDPVVWVSYRDDALAVAAARLMARLAQQLPDLSTVVVLLADTKGAARLRQHLQSQAEQRGYPALLGPRIDTLRGWVDSHALSTRPVLSGAARELLLVEALRASAGLLGTANPWQLAENLVELFDEITLQRVTIDAGLNKFLAQLQRGYRLAGVAPAALSQEAHLVHSLWHAYHAQSDAERMLDPQVAYLQRLAALQQQCDHSPYIYLVGIDVLSAAEAQWCRSLLTRGRAELILQGAPRATPSERPLQALAEALSLPTPAADAHCESFFDTCFDYETIALAERARDFAARQPHSPVADQLSIFQADGAEQEASAIDIQVRQWLLEGKRSISIVTENRRLARRVRALLERAGLALQDSAGWALSTTRAAATLERWLETVEGDFAQQPLLDLLKSPFLFSLAARAEVLPVIHRFEFDIVRAANIARGLQRYRDELKSRRHRLPYWTQAMNQRMTALLDTLAHAAAPLQRYHDGRRHEPLELLDALQESLQRLGLAKTLVEDPAGERLCAAFDQLRAALPGRRLRIDWTEFRTWLGRMLEQHNFLPPGDHGPVQLINLAQSRLLYSDALIIAGADRAHLPGASAQSPFFNQGVRKELGLPTWRDTLAQRLYRFRRLLDSAPTVLITWCAEQDGAAITPSPWVDALQTFHRLAYGCDLSNLTLAPLTAEPRTQIAACDSLDTPTPRSRPRPMLTATQVPTTLTVSAHQHLINCPYQFFAADCLRLATPDEVSETLDKSDYGQRVHKCLQAFHGGLDGLPGPVSEPISSITRTAAIALLTDLSRAVFAKDLEDNFQHRGWLRRWLQIIPAYIDWQIERQLQWEVHDVERAENRSLSTDLALKGRLDRIDRSGGAFAIVDYKTGATPRQVDVDNGEDVQLCSYALLIEDVTQVEYLKLDGDKVHVSAQLQGAALLELAKAVGERLVATCAALREGAALPAWGDAQTCARCAMDGLCRRQAWNDTELIESGS